MQPGLVKDHLGGKQGPIWAQPGIIKGSFGCNLRSARIIWVQSWIIRCALDSFLTRPMHSFSIADLIYNVFWWWISMKLSGVDLHGGRGAEGPPHPSSHWGGLLAPPLVQRGCITNDPLSDLYLYLNFSSSPEG